MENYISEIAAICKLPFDEARKTFKVIQIGTKSIYVCNFIKIIDYSREKIALKVTNNTLEITGSDLSILQINKSEIIIVGIIYSCGLGKVNEKK